MFDFDKKIKKALGKKTNSFKSMMGDWDKDGVKNIMDCKPWNKKKTGFMHKTTVPIADYPKSYGYRGSIRMVTPERFMRDAQQTTLGLYSRGDEAQYWTSEEYEKRVISRDNLVHIKAGLHLKKNQVPIGFIETKKGKPYDHEGRHRAVAAREMGYKRIPVVYVETDKDYIKQLTDDSDGDGVSNMSDCDVNDPSKQGGWHKKSSGYMEVDKLISGPKQKQSRQFDKDDLYVDGSTEWSTRRKPDESKGEHWAPIKKRDSYGNIKTVMVIVKPRITQQEVNSIMASSFLTWEERIARSKEKGASDSMIKIAGLHKKFGRKRY